MSIFLLKIPHKNQERERNSENERKMLKGIYNITKIYFQRRMC